MQNKSCSPNWFQSGWGLLESVARVQHEQFSSKIWEGIQSANGPKMAVPGRTYSRHTYIIHTTLMHTCPMVHLQWRSRWHPYTRSILFATQRNIMQRRIRTCQKALQDLLELNEVRSNPYLVEQHRADMRISVYSIQGTQPFTEPWWDVHCKQLLLGQKQPENAKSNMHV